MERKVLIGVDEFTITLHNSEEINTSKWGEKAEEYIIRFLELSKLNILFGKLSVMNYGIPAGYNTAYTFENVNGYFGIAYHYNYPKMGVCCRFSAEFWAWYLKRFEEIIGERIRINSFLNMVASTAYRIRLTRIDITADYYNYGEELSPNTIYSDLISQKVVVEDYNGRSAKRKLTQYGNQGQIESIMIGSRASGTNCLGRIYNKRAEQIERFGFRYDEAIKCDSWVRMEISYRKKYATTIGRELILDVKSDIELTQYLTSKILDKFRFYSKEVNDYTLYTKELLQIMGNNSFPSLRSESPKNNLLKKSILYLCKGSGLFPTFYKFREIFGTQGEKALIEFLTDTYNNTFIPEAKKNRQLIAWIKKNYDSLHNCSLSEILQQPESPIDITSPFQLTNKTENTENTENLKPEDSELIKDESFISIFNMED